MNPMTGFKDFEQFQIAFENGPIENRAGCSQILLRALEYYCVHWDTPTTYHTISTLNFGYIRHDFQSDRSRRLFGIK